jgi:hypothetical protein
MQYFFMTAGSSTERDYAWWKSLSEVTQRATTIDLPRLDVNSYPNFADWLDGDPTNFSLLLAHRLEILQLFLSGDGHILWLDDPDQNLLNKPALNQPGFVRLRVRQNYRSPYSIARFMRQHLPFDFEPANPLPGLGVGVHNYQAPEDQVKSLEAVLSHLLSLGFASEEIVILSLQGVGKSPLWRSERIGRQVIRRFTGNYRPDGSQVWSEGEITLDSLYRFKGQEAPAVILTDIEDRKSQERLQRLLFTGMSRATVRLDLVCNQSNRTCANPTLFFH